MYGMTPDEYKALHWTRKMRFRAHSMLQAAIARGDIPKIDENTKCVDCGEPATVYEHRNYFYPLTVEPVCVGCNVRRGEGFPPVEGKALYHKGVDGVYSWSSDSLTERRAKENTNNGADVHEKRERQPNFFDIYAEQANRIHALEQAIRQLLYSHKDGFHGCCWCSCLVGETHADDCENRRAHQLIYAHDDQKESDDEES